MQQTRYDMIEIKAGITAEGFIRDRPIITRAGIFTYRDINGKLTREYRPDEEVFADASLSSLAGMPITDGHRGLISSDNAEGIIGTIISSGSKQETNVVADVVIHNAKKIGSRRELSLGYRCDIDPTPGEYNGEKYDCIQKNITYNHLAVVMKGRAGNARLRLDSDDAINDSFGAVTYTEGQEMDPKLITIRLDEIDYQASPEVVNAFKKAKDDYTDLKRRYDEIEAERDGLKSKISDHAAEISKVKNTAREELRARLDLENTVKQFDLKFDEADSDIKLKQKVVNKLRPSLKLDGKSDDYISSAFDFAMDEDRSKNVKVTSQKQRMEMKADENKSDDSSDAARARMLARIRKEKEAA